MKRAVATVVLALAVAPWTTGAASASEPIETNVVDRVECMFRVYVTEGGESGLDCLA